MKVHTVELKELQDFQTEQKVLFASSSREQKKLYCTLRGSYEIWHYGVLVLETMQPFSAIKHYNSLNNNKMNKYKEIEFGAGDSIERAIQDLARFKERGELVYGEFNGQKLYSDIDDVDSAYKKVTGKTKSEFDAERKVENDRYKEEQRKHNEVIPELTKKWIEKGNTILDKKYHETWAKCVPIRLSDLYQGMELGASLDIVKELNAGCELDVAKGIIEGQGHSGMSFGLVCSMVKSFCDRGEEFVNYVQS